MATVEDLGRKVKAKHPGSYDDIPDAELGRKVKAKFPGSYDDFADAPAKLGMGDLQASEAPPPAPPPDAPVSESIARGGLQGATLGWGDEAAAGIAALLPFTDREAAKGDTIGKRYDAARTFYRAKNANAEGANPKAYFGAQIAGATAPTLLGGAPLTGAKAAAIAAGQGVAQGAGYSDAEDGSALARDSALGGALGLAGYGAGAVVGKARSSLAAAGARRAGAARDRAGSQAADEVAEQIASARGQLGAETQKGSRYVENLMRLEPAMTPEQRAVYAALNADGTVPGLQRSVAQGTLASLPEQAATIGAKKAAYQGAVEGADSAVENRTADLLTPQVGADAKSFFKRYGEPVVAATLGYKAADLAGMDPESKAAAATTAGLLFGRTRAGKALWDRVNRPAHQYALGKGIENAAQGPAAILGQRALAAGVPAAMTPGTLEGEKTSPTADAFIRWYQQRNGTNDPEIEAAVQNALAGMRR